MSILFALFTLVFTLTACSGDDDDDEKYIIIYADGTGDDDSDSSDNGTSDDDSSSTDPYNGHDYVDLGLSVKWATCNVGASSPEGYGNYYAWGETYTKSNYDRSTSITYNDAEMMNDITGDTTYDAATANWGGTWRTPTSEEIHELIDDCDWTWSSYNGINGMLVTSSNGNFIFLPAAGLRNGSSLEDVGSCGYYWSSTTYSSSDPIRSNSLYFYSDRYEGYKNKRYYGLTIRPVTE